MPCTHYQQLSRHKRFGSAGSKKFHILLTGIPREFTHYFGLDFLTCFVSLLLLRLIQINTNEKYSTKTLINEMRNITGTYVDKNYYMFDYYNEIVEDLGKTVGIDFSKRFMTLGEIKKIISQTKN